MEKDISCSKIITLCGFLIASTSYVFTSDELCSKFINATKNYGDGTNYFTLQKTEVLRLQQDRVSCVYHLLSKGSLTAINISTSRYSLTDTTAHSRCNSEILRIKLYLYEGGNSVQEIDCVKSGEWIILWPWRTVVMEIEVNDARDQLSKDLEDSTLELKVVPFRSYKHGNVRDRLHKKVNLPWNIKSPPTYCLKRHSYEVEYVYGLFSVRGLRRIQKVNFYVVQKSLCIRTFVNDLFTNVDQCPWEVHLSVKDRVLMMLKCEIMLKYWCLPESWFEERNELLEVKFVKIDKSMLGRYTIRLATNSSAYGSCPLTTTPSHHTRLYRTIPYRTTTYGYKNNNDNVDDSNDDSSPSGTFILLVLVGAVSAMMIPVLFIVCCQRKTAQNSRTIIFRNEGIQGNPYTRTDVRPSPVRGPISTEITDENILPLNHFGTTPTAQLSEEQNDISAPPNYEELTNRMELDPLAPPPSYEDALEMMQK